MEDIDTNALLEKLRKLKNKLLDDLQNEEELDNNQVLEFLETFEALDDAIQEDGCLPDDWGVS